MSADPNYRNIIAHGGFRAACTHALTALRGQEHTKLAELQLKRANGNAGYRKFAKLMADSKSAAFRKNQQQQRAEIDIYKRRSSNSNSQGGASALGGLNEEEEARAAEELKRMLQARLDAENQTQVQMLLDERARRAKEKRLKEKQQFELEFRKFDDDESGGIDPMELPQILDQLIQLGPGGVPHEVINDVILTCDADGDGTLDFDEFCEIMWTLRRDYTDPEPELTDAQLIQVLREEAVQKVKEAEARFHQAAKVQAASGANRAILWERDPPHPTRLDLSGTPQNLRQFIEVAEALAKDVHVVTVSLDFCELGPRSGQALATAMLQNQKISTLTLDGNHIGPAGAVALFRSIADHGTLVQLDLKRNGLASDGGLALGRALAKNTTLTTLDVSWNSFGPSGAAAVLDALATNKTLRVLRFDGNDITPAGAQALSNGLRRNRGLEELYIAWNELGSAGGRALGSSLGENQQLRVLDVSGNALGDAGTLAVSDGLALNGTLLELVLDDNTIGGVGITGLARSLVANHQLQRLSLGWNSCDSGGAAALARALATNKALVHLDLSNNLTLGRGGEVEFAFGSLGEALRCNRGNFCSLNLHGAGAGPEGARALAAAVVGQTSFARYGKKASVVHQERHENASQPAKADEVATPASDAQLVCGQIEDARKGRSFGGTADRFVQTVNPKIKELIISGNNLGPNGAIALAQLTGLCRELRILHVGFNKNGPIPIGYEGSVALFKALAGYFVAQRDSESRSENSVPWWKEQVQHVVFSESEARLKELASQLEPDDCDNSVEESQFSIAERDSHTSVGAHGDTSASSEMLIGHGVDGHSAESQFISLASVAGAPTSSSADSDVAGPTGKVPGSILRLERLDMEGCLIGADAAIDLCEHLIAQRFTVATLNLNCCWLRLRGGHALALALRNNIPNLVHLDLSCNQLGPQNGSWLGDALALNAVLKRLSLYNNRIRCDGLVGLGRGLAKNKALEWLNLAANGIKGRGVREFSRLIAPNKTILHVDLDQNPATTNGDRLEANSVVIVQRLCECNRARAAQKIDGAGGTATNSTGSDDKKGN